MCAIAGFAGLSCDQAVEEKLFLTMHRRGPDESGVYRGEACTLLHSRLIIIDPEGGKQPMGLSWGGETYTLVYNGELYNTQQIRRELQGRGHRFAGRSDTEVVLHAYAEYGAQCLHLLNGIFAFAVWEEKTKRLFLARDRMGVKPLFYRLQDSGMLFASEMKTILAFPGVPAELDSRGASELLLLGPGRIPGSGVFHGIYSLEPGCCGYFQEEKWVWWRYWSLKDRQHTESFEETAEHVRYLVSDAIRRQMVSDVPIGTFLSGGLDSSIISALCAGSKDGMLDTFSVDYENNAKFFVPEKFQPNTDGVYIELMQQTLHTNHHWSILKPEDLVDALEEATLARDLPGMADVDFSLLVFCKQIRKSVKVALSGECADEIFGGYPWYRDPQVRDANGFPWAQNTKERITFLSPELSTQAYGEEFVQEQYRQTLNACDILPGTSPLEVRMKQMVNLNQRWFMQTLLDRKDRMSMYSGLEVRVPFCDYRIAEYMYGVPWEFKDHNGQEKGLLRYAMRGVLPDAVLYRKKSPYPKTYDPKYMEMVSDLLRQLLEKRDAAIFHLVDREKLRTLLTEKPQWPWYGQLMRAPQTIAYMLQIQYWLDAYSVNMLW